MPSPKAQDPEKQPVPASAPTPPRLPSPAQSAFEAQYVRDPPYIRMGSELITPASPDPFDRPILGPLSARGSLTSRLGATAMGSTTPLPRTRKGTPTPGAGAPAERVSEYDPATEPLPGTSPYWGGRLAATPDNSVASTYSASMLRDRARQSLKSISTASVSTVEIDRILEMATIYGGADMPDLPQPLVTAPATLRSSAYMAGRESRRTSFAGSSARSGSASPAHSRNNSAALAALQPGMGAGAGTLALRTRAFREPPLATLPSSPLPSGTRPSFDIDGVVAANQQVPRVSALAGGSWSGDGLDGYTMQAPPSTPRG